MKLYETLEQHLKKESNFVTDNGELKKWVVLNKAQNFDEELIGLLLDNDELKAKFFVSVKGPSAGSGQATLVFNQNLFVQFLEQKNYLNDSYTQYKNKVGLTIDGKYLKQRNEVALVWPFKDCILEGGQSREEDKREEIFFNEILAQDEITQLLEPKVLTNAKRILADTSTGSVQAIEIPLNSPLEGCQAKSDGVEKLPNWQSRSLFPFWTLPKNKLLTERARELRKQGILSEVIFWNAFKDKEKLGGWDIDRQVIVGSFIVDFFIAELGLVIEIDGSSHDNKEEYDKEREDFLTGLNLKVIRYCDNDIKNNIEGVFTDFLSKIKDRVDELKKSKLIPPRPSDTPQEGNGFKRDAELNRRRGLHVDTITDNLIIKGNNLLALHTLKEEFAGKVKLIYIDPPYNTGSDSFQYNDSFNESTWLTFMKNRLEIARDLLSKDGKMFIQCDDNEQAYLKILMDEVFKPQNFVETFVWKNTDNAPALSKKTRKNLEFIHCYEKVLDTSKGYVGRDSDNDDAPLLNSGNPITVLEFKPEIIQFRIPDGNYPKGINDKVELLDDLVVKNGKNENKIRLKGRLKWQQTFLDNEVSNGTYFLIKSNKFSIRYQREIASNMAPDKLIDDIYLSKAIGVETNEDSKKHIDSLNLVFNSYPKPETLIGFLIKAVTEEGDIVLDYHLGSGTTASTAHKMNRQYIGIEQMDYIETVAVERLKKVIEGEQGGISKSVNWQGGGSFVYLELKKYNQTFIEQIASASSATQLLEIWEQMKAKSFLNYNVDIKKQDEHIEDFKTLSLKEQKQHLCELLDKNQLYVNLSSLNDADFKCSEEEKRLNHDFYKINHD